MDLILRAIRFAEKKHKGQKRRVTGVDYINHPLTVSYIAAHYKRSKNWQVLVAAAHLHDTVEDTNTTFEELVKEFGMPVASLVYELTDNKELIKKVGKLEYQKKRWVGLSNYGMYLKLCDRLNNMMDSPTPVAIEQTVELLGHIEKNRKLTNSHKAVVAEIKKVINERLGS